MTVRNAPAEETEGKIKQNKIYTMKKIVLLFIIGLIGSQYVAGNIRPHLSPMPTGISITIATKAYWDGATKSCLDREKGWCVHLTIEIDVLEGQIKGELTNPGLSGLTFTFNKRTGILPETLNNLVKNGTIYANGEVTFSEDLLMKLGLPSNYKIKEGYYPIQVLGEEVKVVFK